MSAERKRGRPSVYATKAERDAAHAAAKRKKRDRERERQEQRREAQIRARYPDHPQHIVNWELTLKGAIESGAPQSLIEAIREEIERERDMQEYERDEAREQRRDRERDAITIEDLKRGAWMKRGEFLSGAPQGEGRLVSEGDLGTSVIRISDAQQEESSGAGGGKRVTPKGHSIRSHEETDYRKQPIETESQFVDKWFPKSKLRCHGKFKGKDCLFEVVVIIPQKAESE